MDNKDDKIKTLLKQLSKLDASIFYLENVVDSLESKLDQNDVDVSIKILMKIRNDKFALLNNYLSRKQTELLSLGITPFYFFIKYCHNNSYTLMEITIIMTEVKCSHCGKYVLDHSTIFFISCLSALSGEIEVYRKENQK